MYSACVYVYMYVGYMCVCIICILCMYVCVHACICRPLYV